jgi:hypothetical protein
VTVTSNVDHELEAYDAEEAVEWLARIETGR